VVFYKETELASEAVFETDIGGTTRIAKISREKPGLPSEPFHRFERQECFFNMYENSPFCSEYPINK
jgi:hypothetical protein